MYRAAVKPIRVSVRDAGQDLTAKLVGILMFDFLNWCFVYLFKDPAIPYSCLCSDVSASNQKRINQ